MTVDAVIVCPLEFERRILERAAVRGRVRTDCCGPGPDAVRAWVETQAPTTPVILCGLAGALREPFETGQAFVAEAVRLGDGSRLTPTLETREAPGRRAVLCSAPATLTTPESKRQCAESTGADLVDRESEAFAAAAHERGWRWSVVRGVSDGPAATLPADIDTWVDARGRSRLGVACRAVAGRRLGIGPLLRLRAASVDAMRSAAALIERMLDESCPGAS